MSAGRSYVIVYDDAGDALCSKMGAQAMAGRRRSSSTGISEKAWVTSGEVARALNMTDAAIRRWAREGLIDAIKTPGGQYRFRREALSNLLRSRSIPKGGRAKKAHAHGGR